MNWWKKLRGEVKPGELLKHHTTFKIGGPAKFFIEPRDIGDLKLLLNLIKRYKIPLLVIGRGSNILISDRGVGGVVLRLSSPCFNKLKVKGGCLELGSGVMLNRLPKITEKLGLSGAEFLAGIPGTVGGALVMNAGVSERVKGQRLRVKGISDLVEDVTVMDYNGNIKTLHKKDIKFGYRKSNLSDYIVLSTCLNLSKADKGQIKNKIKKYMSYRKATQDLSRPSAGCIFKNPKGFSAGRLIDLCGLKGKRVGDACISGKHANFILNLKYASAGDVFKLMDLIRKEVENKFNIALKPEIKIWQ